MGHILSDLSKERLDCAIEENQREFFRLFTQQWPGAAIETRAGLTRFRTSGQHPLFSVVHTCRDEAGDLDELIPAIQAEHARHSAPLGWLVWPNSHRAATSETFQRHGFVHATDLVGMSIDFRELQQQPVPPAVTITEVQTAAEFAQWMEPCRIGFEFSDQDTAGFHQGLLGVGFGQNSATHHFIAWLNGRPVACSSLFLHGGVAGIYDVATLPEARGHGIGAAITQQPLLYAQEQGYQAGILHATPMGDSVYRRLGFRENYRIPFYAWGMTGH